MEPHRAESRRTPEPERPEQIAERVQRRREGFFGRLKRTFLRVAGLEDLSPERKTVVFVLGAAGLVLLGLGVFTGLSYSWLVTVALVLLPLVFHAEKEDEDDETGSDTGPAGGRRTETAPGRTL